MLPERHRQEEGTSEKSTERTSEQRAEITTDHQKVIRQDLLELPVPIPRLDQFKKLHSCPPEDPKFKKFNGKGDPQHHLRLFVNETLPEKDNKIFLFQKSLEGDAAMWVGSLPVGSFTTFEELAAKFMSQYSLPAPTISDLQDNFHCRCEYVQTFIGRFRELLVKTEVVIPESQAVQMIIQNLRDPPRPYAARTCPHLYRAL
ncbi:UNVERIFIED_CONTAM: hypothetical protein Scaly_2911400 [Sesamum calycinum]|uniref:Retrotransposon gag domain-containing protein n=1 Tax=Sesamum calycinum TaxID=2727403 RepID=A0AAW2L768_9LAMI